MGNLIKLPTQSTLRKSLLAAGYNYIYCKKDHTNPGADYWLIGF